jgi:hypothetical protein
MLARRVFTAREQYEMAEPFLREAAPGEHEEDLLDFIDSQPVEPVQPEPAPEPSAAPPDPGHFHPDFKAWMDKGQGLWDNTGSFQGSNWGDYHKSPQHAEDWHTAWKEEAGTKENPVANPDFLKWMDDTQGAPAWEEYHSDDHKAPQDYHQLYEEDNAPLPPGYKLDGPKNQQSSLVDLLKGYDSGDLNYSQAHKAVNTWLEKNPGIADGYLKPDMVNHLQNLLSLGGSSFYSDFLDLLDTDNHAKLTDNHQYDPYTGQKVKDGGTDEDLDAIQELLKPVHNPSGGGEEAKQPTVVPTMEQLQKAGVDDFWAKNISGKTPVEYEGLLQWWQAHPHAPDSIAAKVMKWHNDQSAAQPGFSGAVLAKDLGPLFGMDPEKVMIGGQAVKDMTAEQAQEGLQNLIDIHSSGGQKKETIDGLKNLYDLHFGSENDPAVEGYDPAAFTAAYKEAFPNSTYAAHLHFATPEKAQKILENILNEDVEDGVGHWDPDEVANWENGGELPQYETEEEYLQALSAWQDDKDKAWKLLDKWFGEGAESSQQQSGKSNVDNVPKSVLQGGQVDPNFLQWMSGKNLATVGVWGFDPQNAEHVAALNKLPADGWKNVLSQYEYDKKPEPAPAPEVTSVEHYKPKNDAEWEKFFKIAEDVLGYSSPFSDFLKDAWKNVSDTDWKHNVGGPIGKAWKEYHDRIVTGPYVPNSKNAIGGHTPGWLGPGKNLDGDINKYETHPGIDAWLQSKGIGLEQVNGWKLGADHQYPDSINALKNEWQTMPPAEKAKWADYEAGGAHPLAQQPGPAVSDGPPKPPLEWMHKHFTMTANWDQATLDKWYDTVKTNTPGNGPIAWVAWTKDKFGDKEQHLAPQPDSPGLQKFLREDEGDFDHYYDDPHFKKWFNKNLPDWDPSTHDTAETVWDYQNPWRHELPPWMNDTTYSDEAMESFDDWASEEGPEQMHAWADRPDGGGGAAQKSFHDFLQGRGIHVNDDFDQAMQDIGLDPEDIQYWKSNLSPEAIEYFKGSPAAGYDDYFDWSSYDNGDSWSYDPPYPGGTSLVNYSGMGYGDAPDSLTNTYGYALAPGVGAFLLKQYPHTSSDDDINELDSSQWEDLENDWWSLPDSEKQKYQNVEMKGVHPFDPQGQKLLQSDHQAMVTSPEFKEWYKKTNNGASLDDSYYKDQAKMLHDEPDNTWTQQKVNGFQKYLDVKNDPDFQQFLKDRGYGPDFNLANPHTAKSQWDAQVADWTLQNDKPAPFSANNLVKALRKIDPEFWNDPSVWSDLVNYGPGWHKKNLETLIGQGEKGDFPPEETEAYKKLYNKYFSEPMGEDERPDIVPAYGTPKNLLTDDGSIVPEFQQWMWDNKTKDMSPQQFLDAVNTWSSAHWIAAAEAFENSQNPPQGDNESDLLKPNQPEPPQQPEQSVPDYRDEWEWADVVHRLKKADSSHWDEDYLDRAEDPTWFRGELENLIKSGEAVLAKGLNQNWSEEELDIYRDLLHKYFPSSAAAATSGPAPLDVEDILKKLHQADPYHWDDYKMDELRNSNWSQQDWKDYIKDFADGGYPASEMAIYNDLMSKYFSGDPAVDGKPQGSSYTSDQMVNEISAKWPISGSSLYGASPDQIKNKLKDWTTSAYSESIQSHAKMLLEKFFGSPSASPTPPQKLPPGVGDAPEPPALRKPPTLEREIKKQLGEFIDKLRAPESDTVFNDDDIKLARSEDFQQWFAKAPEDYRKVVRQFPHVALDDYAHGGEYNWVPEDDGPAQVYKLLHYPEAEEQGGKVKQPGGETTQLPGDWDIHWPGNTKNPQSKDRARPDGDLEFIPRGPDVPGQLEIPLGGGSSWEPLYKNPTVRRGLHINFNRYKLPHPDEASLRQQGVDRDVAKQMAAMSTEDFQRGYDQAKANFDNLDHDDPWKKAVRAADSLKQHRNHYHLLSAPGEIGARHRAAAQTIDEIRELMLGTKGIESKNRIPTLFDDDDSKLPEGMPTIPSRHDGAAWMDLFAWGQKNQLSPEQMWLMAQQGKIPNPEKWGTPPLSYLVEQSKRNPAPMARQVGKLIGEPGWASNNPDLSSIEHKLRRISEDWSDTYDKRTKMKRKSTYPAQNN